MKDPIIFKVYYIFTSSKNSSVSYEQKNVQRVIVIDLDTLREFRATGKKNGVNFRTLY